MEPLREVADEIVLAADSRIAEEDLAEYEAVADRVLRRAVEYFEPNLAWLHEQCSCDWILRLDSDEVPSTELVECLPELIAAADVQQYWLAWRWLDQTGGGWLDEIPWYPEFHNRLVRNDGTLSFSGTAHSGADPVLPARFVETPVYHLQCALRSREDRLEYSFLSYELRAPGRIAPGGGPFNATYYLPERFARRPPAPIPDADLETLSAALGRRVEPTRPHAAEAARSERPLSPLGRDLRMHGGERRNLVVPVENDGANEWPGGVEEPPVRVSYHWRSRSGEVVVFEGERSPPPAPIRPGEVALVPVTVAAPDEPGRYVLELDLVEEGVRWFSRGARFDVPVVPAAATERNVPGVWRRLRRQRIPRVIHRIWLGPNPMPAEHERFGETWAEQHPAWEQRLWTDDDLAELAIPAEVTECAKDPSELSDVVRYHVLARYGGVYVDTDFESLRPLDGLLGGVQAFAAFESPGAVGCGLIGCVPGHCAFRRAAHLSVRALEVNTDVRRTGPPLLTHVLWDFPEVTLFPSRLFYPYDWREPHRRLERFADAYAVHHWAMSWAKP